MTATPLIIGHLPACMRCCWRRCCWRRSCRRCCRRCCWRQWSGTNGIEILTCRLFPKNFLNRIDRPNLMNSMSFLLGHGNWSKFWFLSLASDILFATFRRLGYPSRGFRAFLKKLLTFDQFRIRSVADADADVNIQHESKISFFRRKVSKLFFLPKKSQRNQFRTFFLSTNLPLEDNLVALSGVEKPRWWT